ncbi:hypothetical protein Micbo1qcDRAFT_224915 [Microdochium bolleyi]|uniref:Ubiquitin-like protease family profile domain-containing protein n=1 Tax=Microdochium bolleyi TaxID=196109 RepID=A0A136IJL2_9PEZI|nr:hypothetical protein Micbo1qcDRAFT_224915 [Microdochium bolleyi]
MKTLMKRALLLALESALKQLPSPGLSQAKTAVESGSEQEEQPSGQEEPPSGQDEQPSGQDEQSPEQQEESSEQHGHSPEQHVQASEQGDQLPGQDDQPNEQHGQLRRSDRLKLKGTLAQPLPEDAPPAGDSNASHVSVTSQATSASVSHNGDTPMAADVDTLTIAAEPMNFLADMAERVRELDDDIDPSHMMLFGSVYSKMCDPLFTDTWSGTMWINVVNSAEMNSRRATIFKMVAYMGFSQWFEHQMQEYKEVRMLQEKGRPRQRAASVILDRVLEKDDRHSNKRRTRLIRIRSHGTKLRTIIDSSGWWILFHDNLWCAVRHIALEGTSTKTSRDFVKCQNTFSTALADLKHLEYLEPLAEFLSRQIQILLSQGRTNFALFLENLATSAPSCLREYAGELRAEYGMVRVAASDVDSKLAELRARLLYMFEGVGKCDGTDDVWINQKFQVACHDFESLGSDNCLNSWMIHTALELVDKPSTSTYHTCISLDECKSRNKIAQVSEGAQQIINVEDHTFANGMSEARESLHPEIINVEDYEFGKVIPQASERPLEPGNPLTKFNVKDSKIRFYNSMSTPASTAFVRTLVESEFKAKGFTFEEVPCPQQTDATSCGLSVIHIASLRMNHVDPTLILPVHPDAERAGLIDSVMCALDRGVITNTRGTMRDQNTIDMLETFAMDMPTI